MQRLMCAVVACCLVGCGNANMSGKVTFDKKPVVFGTIQVIGPDRMPRQATIAPDGSYSIKDIPPGDVKVGVTSVDPKSLGKKILRREGVDPKLDPNFEKIQGWFPIPDTVGDANTSGLTFKLSRGDNPIDIELKK